MSDDALHPAVQLVHERGRWSVYTGTDDARETHDDAGLAAWLAGAAPRPPVDTAPYERREWRSRGWSAAYDFAVALYGTSEPLAPARTIVDPSPPGVARGVVEHYPAAPTAPPLTADTLLECLVAARLHEAPAPLVVLVAALSVDGVEPGWYRPDGSPWPGAVPPPDEAGLATLAPVAFGRAGYEVQALVVVAAVDPALPTYGSRAYARLLVTGGVVLALLEGAASDRGLSLRGNYGIDGSLPGRLGLPADGVLPVGAVALGAR